MNKLFRIGRCLGLVIVSLRVRLSLPSKYFPSNKVSTRPEGVRSSRMGRLPDFDLIQINTLNLKPPKDHKIR